jgi:beta-lactamase class D
MKTFSFFIVSQLLLANTFAFAKSDSLEQTLNGRNACVIVMDLKDQKIIRRLGKQCEVRTTPCSSFKIPIALMAFQEGKLTERNSSRKWDGHVTGNSGWDRDQTAASWLENSVVWFSRRLTTEMGMDNVKKYLKEFNYGNQDMSGGITQSWINSSLKISPDEQITFMNSLWKRQWPLSKNTYDKVFDILPSETFLNGTLKGKTGSSGLFSENKKSQKFIGWYISFYSNGRDYAIVSRFQGTRKSGESLRPGLIAQSFAKAVLESLPQAK